MLEFVPHEYEIVEGEGEINFIVFCDLRLVPNEIPENVTYIAKLNGSIDTFKELLLIYEEEFKALKTGFIVLGLGTWDITKSEKQLSHHHKTKELDYHYVQKYQMRFASTTFNCFCDQLNEVRPGVPIVTIDPISLPTDGYHNNTVFYMNENMVPANENHVHLNTFLRFQRDFRKKKIRVDRFPFIHDRFSAENELIEEEKSFLIRAALLASSVQVGERVVVGDAHFKRKF